MSTQIIPIGHINLGFATMPASQLCEYTSDVARFLKYFELAQQLELIKPGSSEAMAVFEQADDTEEFLLTSQEIGLMAGALAEKLMAEMRSRETMQ